MCKGNQRIIDCVNRINHDAIDSTIEYIPSIQKSSRKYIEGFVRWHCEGQVDLTNEHDLSRLDLFLRALSAKRSWMSFFIYENFHK